jgi:hypothetical protein
VKNISGGEMDKKIKQIRTASSIVDYVSQFMLNNFGESTGKIDIAIQTTEQDEEQSSLQKFSNDEGIVCSICGGAAKRIGNCQIFCTSCKQIQRSGCGE